MNSDPPSKPWITLCHLDEIRIGEAVHIEHDERGYCVIRVDEENARVLDDVCPHAGAPISGGKINGDCWVCPWHRWEFRLSNGRCPDNEVIHVRGHSCRVRDGRVEFRVVPYQV